MDNNMRDGNYVIFDWKANLYLERYSLDDKYILSIDDEKLTLKVNEEVVCKKTYSLLDENKELIQDNNMPTYICPSDNDSFDVFSYFIYGGGSSNLKGIINNNNKQVEFVVNYGMKGMKLGGSLPFNLLNKK